MEKMYAGKTVEVNEEGYFLNPSEWNREMAHEIASEMGITLTDAHWKVLNFLANDFKETGKISTIRRMKKTGGIDTKELYTLFPEGPLMKACKIVGLPKPVSCV